MMAMLVADAWALGWVGLWLGLKAKSSWVPALGALGRIIFLPMCVFMAASLLFLLANPGSERRRPMVLVGLWALIGGLNSWFFGADARSKLRTRFRQILTDAPRASSSLPAPTVSAETVEAPPLGEYFSLFKTE
jgi:hypothetical protein